jgi:tRNA (guanine37-N1)-methyltransferase
MPAKDDAAPASGGGQGRRLDVFSLFPAAFDWYLSQVHVRRAADLGTRIAVWNYRDFTPLRHLQVDDTPFGGGAGMVLRIDVVAAALEAVYGVDCEQVRQQRRVIELTPKGRQLDDALATELAQHDVCLLCGRYEGLDERVTHLISDRVSVGPYVISGGELAAMVTLDAVVRKIEGSISNPDSIVQESFATELGGGTEYPQYTRPAEFRGWRVPDVLLSGHHGEIARWRAAQVNHKP